MYINHLTLSRLYQRIIPFRTSLRFSRRQRPILLLQPPLRFSRRYRPILLLRRKPLQTPPRFSRRPTSNLPPPLFLLLNPFRSPRRLFNPIPTISCSITPFSTPIRYTLSHMRQVYVYLFRDIQEPSSHGAHVG
jgi:hypothetical protein